MTNLLKMMKQMKEVRRLQKELESKLYEASSADGLVRVTVKGDMTLKTIRIDPQLLEPKEADRLAQLIVGTINRALETSKKAAAADMAKLAGGMGGLADLLGS